MTSTIPLTDRIAALQDRKRYEDLHWTGSFEEYLAMIRDNPRIARTSYERLYDMILSHGTEEYVDNKKRITRFGFFSDNAHGGRDAVFGLDIPLMRLVNVLKAAALRYGPERRIILLHGPVGSSKSTIVRLLKRGMEEYSRTPEGALYTYEWVLPEQLRHLTAGQEVYPSPMHEEPLKLIPPEIREEAITQMGLEKDGFRPYIRGNLNPACRYIFRELMLHHEGDLSEVLKHIRVRRLLISEEDRVGIGTFQPKDEKNQDSTELTGDINYRRIAELRHGHRSPRLQLRRRVQRRQPRRHRVRRDPEARRRLPLRPAHGATQEHKIKPKKFAQTDIDEVIIGHTNEAEYQRLLENKFMEALRDRTVKIDIPYITKLTEEIKIYAKDYNAVRVRGRFIAPHTLEMAAMWALLTRLEEPKKHQLSLLQKLKLYDGKTLPGFTQDSVKELRKETKSEGMEGISPRYVQDKIANCLVSDIAVSSASTPSWCSTSSSRGCATTRC